MYLVLLSLALISGLTVARRLVEPSCPGCAAKSWIDTPPVLQCTECGWTNLAVATLPVAVESAPRA